MESFGKLHNRLCTTSLKQPVGCRTFFVGTYQPQSSPERTSRPDNDTTRRPCLIADNLGNKWCCKLSILFFMGILFFSHINFKTKQHLQFTLLCNVILSFDVGGQKCKYGSKCLKLPKTSRKVVNLRLSVFT